MNKETENKIESYIDQKVQKRKIKGEKKVLKGLQKQMDEIDEGTRFTLNSHTGEVTPYHREKKGKDNGKQERE